MRTSLAEKKAGRGLLDTANFRRTLAGICLITQPLLNLISVAISPRQSTDTSEQLAMIGGDEIGTDPAGDIDLGVYGPDGELVAASAGPTGLESVTLFKPVPGQYQVVVINRGARHGVVPGNVMAVDQVGELIRERKAGYFSSPFGKSIRLPSERAGTMLVFKTFDRISYGLIVGASSEPIYTAARVGDVRHSQADISKAQQISENRQELARARSRARRAG